MFALGTRLGAYELGSILGVGGMGEVYRARDTKLGRHVAIKVLPAAFSADPERTARFQREAEVLASLNHPHIGAIYGFEEANGTRFLILELVDGETLATRIQTGALPVGEALGIATQIAEALDAAHDKGVIHRDLKPSNVALTAEGQVKVLDFGLAKLAPTTAAVGASASDSPTITSPALVTGVGMLLGTAAYMAPEQAKGREADNRSDVWAFGCVLFEMLTGKRAFEGDDVSDTLASVLKGEPAWSALPSDLSASVHTLLRSCLEKDRRQRLSAISSALFVLKHNTSWTASNAPALVAVGRPRWVYAAVGMGVVAVALGSGWFGWTLRHDPRTTQRTKFVDTLPAGSQFTNAGRQLVSIAPDGLRYAYAADNRVYVRGMDQLPATPLDATAGTGDASPRALFFSPDSQWIGYWADGMLRKISVHGGAPVPVSAAENPAGASWSGDGTIVYAQTTGVWRVSDTSGPPVQIMKSDLATMRVQSPQLLPGGRALLVTVAGEKSFDEADIVVQLLDGGARTTLLTGKDARYVSSGHLLYTVGGVLLARRFDAASLMVSGGPVAVVEGIAQSPNRVGPAQYSVSESGTLVYVKAVADSGIARTITWVDRQGHEEPINARSRAYLYPRLSHDNSRIALDAAGETLLQSGFRSRNIWIRHLNNHTETILTDRRGDNRRGDNRSPTWTFDDKRIIFTSDRDGFPDLFWQSADGLDGPTKLLGTRQSLFAHSVTPDGKWVVIRQNPGDGGTSNADLMRLSLDDPRQVEPLVTTPASEFNGEVSPNGLFLAYQSDRSGPFEVFVRRFPKANPGEEWQVSTAGGTEPLWLRTSAGTELFYRSPTGAIMRIKVPDDSMRSWAATTPVQVLPGTGYHLGVVNYPYRTYDISNDGLRFLMLKNGAITGEQRATPDLVIFRNWIEELKRRVPSD